MRIAIYLGRAMLGDGWQEMVEQLFLRLAIGNPQHSFFFISTNNEKKPIVENLSSIVISPQSQHIWLLAFWYDYTLPSILRKNQIDVFVDASGAGSFRTNVPQILLFKDLSFLQRPKKAQVKNGAPLKKRFSNGLKKAALAMVATQLEERILHENKLGENKTGLLPHFADPVFQPTDWQQKEAIKERYSNGREYFLVACNETELTDWMVLLKAFSMFKKRQQSNMQLLILGEINDRATDLHKKMNTYKYRNDVRLLGSLPLKEQASLFSAAYCLVHTAQYPGFAMPVLQAMQAGLPIIVLGNNGFLAEIADGAALYAENHTPEALAAQLQTVFKDESLRSRLVAEGQLQTSYYTLDKAAAAMWACVQKVTK